MNATKPAKPTKGRILIVDDEPLVCDAVKMILNFDGYAVETAGDGQQALAKFETGKFDLVITDFEMPVMKGDQLAAAIKGRSPQQPILMLTAHGEMLKATQRVMPGIDLVVDKPFRLDALRAAIAQVIGSSQDKKAAP